MTSSSKIILEKSLKSGKFNYIHNENVCLNYLVQLNLYKDYCNVFNYFFFENHFGKVIKKWEI
jgi:hypothetical protein